MPAPAPRPAAPRSRAVFVLGNLLLPGAGDLYLGPATRRRGRARLAALAAGVALIFAFGLGLLVLALVWLASLAATRRTLAAWPRGDAVSAPIDRRAPTRRSPGRAVGRRGWRPRAFLHGRVPAAALRPLVPSALDLDTDR